MMVYTKVANTVLLLVGVFNLIGCTHLNSDFDCPMKPGITCESIDQINARVDSGQFNHADKTCVTGCEDIPEIGYLTTSLSAIRPRRSKEKVMKIFVASYVDKEGNFHDPNAIYTVTEPSHWTT